MTVMSPALLTMGSFWSEQRRSPLRRVSRPWLGASASGRFLGERDSVRGRVAGAEYSAGGVQVVDDQQDPFGHAVRILQPALCGNGVELPAQRVEVSDGHLVGRVAGVTELAVCVQGPPSQACSGGSVGLEPPDASGAGAILFSQHSGHSTCGRPCRPCSCSHAKYAAPATSSKLRPPPKGGPGALGTRRCIAVHLSIDKAARSGAIAGSRPVPV
jgi:hypothetical protein